MKIAVVSDSHDNIWNMRIAVEQANSARARLMIHCGDLISPFMLEELDAFEGHIHLIMGNNSGDQILLMKRLQSRSDHVTFHGWHGAIEASGMKIGFSHMPDAARLMARSGDFRMVFYGHTHLWNIETAGETMLLNPGEIMGKKEPAGWALVDLDTGGVEHMTVNTAGGGKTHASSPPPGGLPVSTEDKKAGNNGQQAHDGAGPSLPPCEALLLHVRPDLYRACMRCIWMMIHEQGMTPLEAQNLLIENFLRHHGC